MKKFLFLVPLMTLLMMGCHFKLLFDGKNEEDKKNEPIPIMTGERSQNMNEVERVQKSVDEGHQPWRLDPYYVLITTIYPNGDASRDLSRETIQNVSLNLKSGIAIYTFLINEKPYQVTVRQPIIGKSKIWYVSDIESLPTHCYDVTGRWRGEMSNPDRLFGNGGPWAASIEWKNYPEKNDTARLVGVLSVQAPISRNINGPIYALCESGRITKIVLGHKKCGRYGEGEKNEHNMSLILPYQNAMIDSDLIVNLEKIDEQTSDVPKKQIALFPRQALESCH